MRHSILAFCIAFLAGPAWAHEFWISPERYRVEPGGTMQADIRVGENFKGGGYPFIPANFKRFDLVQGNSVVPVTATIGDRPALAMAAPSSGLWVVVHQTKDYALTYGNWPKFERFTADKDMAWAQDEHVARRLPKEGFRERYSRYGKSLIAVGDGAGADRAVGLLTEIVALANPYTDAVSGGMPFLVLYEGAPRANVQVEVFERRADGSVAERKYRTDAAGRVTVPVAPGAEYLVNSVVIRAIEARSDSQPVWETYWASLTFAVPQ
ncbi:MAG: DUF4198 domain-containing protein [Pseudomonadota bacterium]